MRRRVGDVERIAVGVLPISKLRTRIRVPGPVIQMLFDPSEMLTWRLRVPSPAKRAGSPPPPARVTPPVQPRAPSGRSEEHTSELQSLMRFSYAVFCLYKTTFFLLFI